ncbi:MAG: hypothetical protein HQK55_03230 [Deltaproteobacteria bacterium]|nr:hypothetical protein [Deltaproteobacteria bacterium]
MLRLRDYYRWEHGFAPWTEVDGAKILDWIEQREECWSDLTDREPEPLIWGKDVINPFETEKINIELAIHQLYYGAGYAAFLKPTYFIARIIRIEQFKQFRIIYLGDELARDLFTAPAQTRGQEIVARRQPMTAFLWDTVLNAGGRRRQAVDAALAEYRIDRSDLARPPQEWTDKFYHLVDLEIEASVWHEYGEVSDQAFPLPVWRHLIANHPHSRLELMARTIKDLLADTGPDGRLAFIVDGQRLASLALYLGRLEGLPQRLFPEIHPAFERFLTDRNWQIVEEVRRTAWDRFVGMAQDMVALVEESADRADWLSEQVEARFFKPWGL